MMGQQAAMAKACMYLCHQCFTLVASVNSVESNTDDESETKTYLTRSSWRRCLYAGCDVCV